MGIIVLHQGTDKDCVVLSAVASYSLVGVPEVSWGATFAVAQQRAMLWLEVLAEGGVQVVGCVVGVSLWHLPKSLG